MAKMFSEKNRSMDFIGLVEGQGPGGLEGDVSSLCRSLELKDDLIRSQQSKVTVYVD